MKYPAAFLMFMCVLFSITILAGPSDNWERVDSMYSPTKEPAHATLLPYPGVQSALLSSGAGDSLYYKLLSGTWKFKWVKRPADRPVGFENPSYNVSGWNDIKVPGSLETQGFGIPIYVDEEYPFDADAKQYPNTIPDIPDEDNPVGSYRRDFTIPAEWQGREVFITFEGVQSGFYLWINGEYVGYSENSFSPAEFNIARHLKTGTNTVAAAVYRWTDGCYLECQDMWRLTGIFRDVYLFSTPQVHIRDFWSQAALDANYANGTWKVTAKVKNYGAASVGAHTLEVQLLDENNTQVASNTNTITQISSNAEQIINFSTKTISNPKKWSAEEPNLYTTLLILNNSNGDIIEVEKCRTGFTRVEIKGNLTYFNGQLIKMKGVNRHEFDPDLGRTARNETMVQDITLMKQFNVNALRMSHYPNNTRMYDLCDTYGIYVMDEANNECHGMGWDDVFLTNSAQWKPVHIDRIFSMAQTNKNHPCIWSWSLGNEAGIGRVYWFLTDSVHAFDPSRIVHYEGTSDESDDPSDVLSHMYHSHTYIQNYTGTRPLFINEYCHAMGTALGNLKEYWDAIERNNQCMGACIWDWVDQALRKPGTTNQFVYATFFPEYESDSNFCLNGLVSADRKYLDELWECKKVFQYIKMSAQNIAVSKKITVKNSFWFTDLNRYTIDWAVIENGVQIQNGNIQPISLPPGNSATVDIPFDNSNFTSNNEYFLTVCFRLKDKTLWADIGHIIAWEQFQIPATKEQKIQNPEHTQNRGDLTVQEVGSDVIISGKVGIRDLSVTFNKTKGILAKVYFHALRIIDNTQETGSAALMNVYRAPTDNDYGEGNTWSNLKELGGQNVSVFNWNQPSAAEVVVNITNTFSSSASHQCKYTVRGDGTITMENRLTPPSNKLPRVGILMTADKNLNNVQWYGRGPDENYFDRKTGYPIGIYRRNVAEMFVPQVKPQENGSRQDVRWIRLFNSAGIGMKVSSTTPFAINASYYSPKDLVSVRYNYALPDPGDITLCIDAKQRGLGNASCGPAVLSKYEITNSACDLNFTISLDSISATNTIEQTTQLPGKIKVYHTVSSPNSPTVKFNMTLPCASFVNFSLYDIMGRKIKQVFNDRLKEGGHSLQWDKTNDSNTRVCSGVYFYKVTVKNRNVTNVVRKFTLLQ